MVVDLLRMRYTVYGLSTHSIDALGGKGRVSHSSSFGRGSAGARCEMSLALVFEVCFMEECLQMSLLIVLGYNSEKYLVSLR